MLDKNVLNKTEPKNRKLTERKLIDAVGDIIRSTGYTGLGVNAIAKNAGVSKKLIYRYFGTVDSLIETYLVERDYWVTFSKKVSDAAVASNKKQTMIEFSEAERKMTLNKLVSYLQNAESEDIIAEIGNE